MLRRVLSLSGHEARYVLRDPFPYFLLLGMPLVITMFVSPAYKPLLRVQGFSSANGAEQAVPGMAVMFVFFFVGYIGYSFYEESTWGTWRRLLLTDASLFEIVVGKASPYVLIVIVQQVLLLIVGQWLFGLDLGGSPLALLALSTALVLFMAALSVALVAVTKTYQQVSAFQTIGTLVLAGIGGVITPIGSLPGWARHVAPTTPTYWAMEGSRRVILEHKGLTGALLPCGVLLLFAAGCAGLTALRLTADR